MNSIIFSRYYEFQAIYNWSSRGNMQITKNPTETATESVEFDFLNFYCFIAIFSPSFHFTQQHLRVVMRFVLCFSYFENILIWMVHTWYFMMISELETQSDSEWPALLSIVFYWIRNLRWEKEFSRSEMSFFTSFIGNAFSWKKLLFFENSDMYERLSSGLNQAYSKINGIERFLEMSKMLNELWSAAEVDQNNFFRY